VTCDNELLLLHTGMQRCGSSEAGECNPADPILQAIVGVGRSEVMILGTKNFSGF
jgi:hypothetical protein